MADSTATSLKDDTLPLSQALADDGSYGLRPYLTLLLPIVVLVLLALWGIGSAQHQALKENHFQQQRLNLQLAKQLLEGELERPMVHLRSLAQLEEVIRTTISAPDHSDLSGMQAAFRSVVTRNPEYAQVRWIGEEGRERVRVDRLRDGQIKRVPEQELQDKSDRYYFRDTMALQRGEIFLSPLDLNVEHGQVELPYNPMLRIATRLFAEDGRSRGILILNLSAGPLLQRFAGIDLQGPGLCLLNDEGYWLESRQSQDEWGFMFGRHDTFAERYPSLWQRMLGQDQGEYDYEHGYWLWTSVYPAPSQSGRQGLTRWRVVTHLSPIQLNEMRKRVWLPLMGGALLLVGLFAVLVMRLVRVRSEKRRTELSLLAHRTSELSTRQALENAKAFIAQAPISIALFDREMRYLAYSQRWLQDYGRGHADLMGLSHYQVHPDLPESWRLVHQRGLAGETIKNDEDLWQHADGSRMWLRWAVLPWYDTSGVIGGIIISAEDITVRMLALEEVRRLNEELEERVEQRTAELAQANAELQRSNRELDEFAYIASHDLKEPLRGIHNYASFLQEDYAQQLDQQGRDFLQRMQRLAERQTELIDRLLAYSRVGRGEMERAPVDLARLLDDVEEDLQIYLREQSAEIQRTTPLPTAVCNRTRMGEVWQNLISNAVKYNDQIAKRIEIGCDESGPEWVFYVRDNGIGIPPQHQENVFRIFKRLHEQSRYGGGTGAGLTIVKKIIERHGGRIWLESTPGEGTTFYFTLGEPAA